MNGVKALEIYEAEAEARVLRNLKHRLKLNKECADRGREGRGSNISMCKFQKMGELKMRGCYIRRYEI